MEPLTKPLPDINRFRAPIDFSRGYYTGLFEPAMFYNEKLYEDNVIGKVSDEWFVELSHKYEKERMDLKAKIADTRHKIEELKNNNSEYEKFISAIRRFMQMDNLTSPLLRELIDHIDIFETEGTGKSRTQRIVIYYRFIGYIELPNTTKHTHIADTRKGVSVKYITKSA